MSSDASEMQNSAELTVFVSSIADNFFVEFYFCQVQNLLDQMVT
jgi:hypothetical protein